MYSADMPGSFTARSSSFTASAGSCIGSIIVPMERSGARDGCSRMHARAVVSRLTLQQRNERLRIPMCVSVYGCHTRTGI
jgi:hypothetical protein